MVKRRRNLGSPTFGNRKDTHLVLEVTPFSQDSNCGRGRCGGTGVPTYHLQSGRKGYFWQWVSLVGTLVNVETQNVSSVLLSLLLVTD